MSLDDSYEINSYKNIFIPLAIKPNSLLLFIQWWVVRVFEKKRVIVESPEEKSINSLTQSENYFKHIHAFYIRIIKIYPKLCILYFFQAFFWGSTILSIPLLVFYNQFQLIRNNLAHFLDTTTISRHIMGQNIP